MSVMIVKARCIVKGKAEGYSIFSNKPINFLAMVDDDGRIIDPNHPLYNYSIKDKILVIPNAVGSSVGAYKIYALKKSNAAPKAIVCYEADTILASGCAIANIPLLDKPDCRLEEVRGYVRIDYNTITLSKP